MDYEIDLTAFPNAKKIREDDHELKNKIIKLNDEPKLVPNPVLALDEIKKRLSYSIPDDSLQVFI